MATIPADFKKREVQAYIAVLLGWREGDPVPPVPKQLSMPVEALMAALNETPVRDYLLPRLSVLVKPYPERLADREADRA